jgi:multiple sugar transport system permease protein
VNVVTTEARPRVRSVAIAHSYKTRERVLGYLLVTPAFLYLTLLLAVPFFYAIYLSLSNATVSTPGQFVGLATFQRVMADSTFWLSLRNTLIFTFGSWIAQSLIGTPLGFLLAQEVPGRKFVRAIIVLPWTIPVALSTIAFKWIFDTEFSVLNWALRNWHITSNPPIWLADPVWAMVAAIIDNTWIGFPFAAVVLLAGLTSIPPEILEAARVDGAGFFRRFHNIIVPMIAPILFVGALFTIVFNMTNLSVIFILTDGGPQNYTQILPTWAFNVGILGGSLSSGAAIALFLLPPLFVLVLLMLRTLGAREW